MKSQLLSLAALLLFARCGQEHQEGSFSAHYKHQPLKEFQDTLVNLPSGTSIRILAYSGGDMGKETDELHYCQFIGINQTTGDTVRILTAAINVEKASTDGKSVLTPSTTYDFDKGVMDATFKVPTENDEMMIKMMPQLQGDNNVPKNIGENKDDAVKDYVMIPEGVPFFIRHYKTAIGILSFNQQPW
jgi:hypothetical protein